MDTFALAFAALLGQMPAASDSFGSPAQPFQAITGGARHPTSIHVEKSAHRLDVLSGQSVMRSFAVALGQGGAGPKRYEGDRTTPVGTYRVLGQFRGLFHRFMNVTYPNEADRRRFAELKARGEVPEGRGIGYGIGIHGVGSPELAGVHKKRDWTFGCIALDDDEVDELASLVPDGITIVITD